jgi:hypothetical protein
MTYDYYPRPTLTINSEDLENITANVRNDAHTFYATETTAPATTRTIESAWTGTTASAWTVSDPFKEEVYIGIDMKLRKYSNVIYDILKDLGRIEIERDEWLSLIDAKMKE